MAPGIDKTQLLTEIAAGGTRAAQAYQQSQQTLMGQQQDAVRAALAGSVVAQAPPGAMEQITNTVQQGYAPRLAQLASNQGISSDYFNKLGATSGAYMDQANALLPAIEAQVAARGSGGGSGGGGSTSNDFLDVLKELGGKENLQDYIKGQAKIMGGDPYANARSVAGQLGVPEALAASWFQYENADDAYLTNAKDYLASGKAKTVHEVKQGLRYIGKQIPGNQAALRRQLVKQTKKKMRK